MFNWGKTVEYKKTLIKPKSFNDLIKIAKKNIYTIIGSGHSFVDIYGGGSLVDFSNFKRVLDIDLVKNTITVEAGIKIYEVEDYLKKYKRCLCAVGSIREQTIAGAASNCVNSLGGNYIDQFCHTIIEIHYINNNGELEKIDGSRIKYYSVHLGSLCGLIYSMKLKISENTFLKYYDEYIDISDIQNYISNIFKLQNYKLCELLYFFNNNEVSVLLAEPFKDKSNIDETRISSNDNEIAIKNNKNGGVMTHVIKHAKEFNKLVNKFGIKYVNRLRNHIDKDINISHYTKLWFRGGKFIDEPVSFMEFYVPLMFLNDIINLLLKLKINKIAYYIQMRPFLKSKHILCPSYKENVVSILFGTTVKDMLNYRHIIDVLNYIGVRWHWGEALDTCIYEGYIERVYSNKVRNKIEQIMINNKNMRPQLKKAIKHISQYKDDWKTMFGKNLNEIKKIDF